MGSASPRADRPFWVKVICADRMLRGVRVAAILWLWVFCAAAGRRPAAAQNRSSVEDGAQVTTGFQQDINRATWQVRTVLPWASWSRPFGVQDGASAGPMRGSALDGALVSTMPFVSRRPGLAASFQQDIYRRSGADRTTRSEFSHLLVSPRWSEGRFQVLSQSRVLSYQDVQEHVFGVVFHPRGALRRPSGVEAPRAEAEPDGGITAGQFQPFLWAGPVLEVRPQTADRLAHDTGLIVGLGTAPVETPLGGGVLSVGAHAELQRTAPRRAHELDAGLRHQGRSKDLSWDTALRIGQVYRETYQSAYYFNRTSQGPPSSTVPIEGTRLDTLAAEAFLEAQARQKTIASIQIDAAQYGRAVRQRNDPVDAPGVDTDFQRQEASLSARLRHQSSRFAGAVGLTVGARREARNLVNEDDLLGAFAAQTRDLLRQADYEEGYYEVQTEGRIDLSPNIRFRTEMRGGILRHDTPAENPDDRDEANVWATLGLNWRASATLSMILSATAHRDHTVYLQRTRSIENGVQQGLRWRPEIRWTPRPGTDVNVYAEVRATYTIDDFVLPGRPRSDQSAREWRSGVTARHRLTDQYSIRAEMRYGELRLGRFIATRFAEIPVDTLQTFSGKMVVQHDARLVSQIGLSWFVRSDHSPSQRVTIDNVTATGPGRILLIRVGPHVALQGRVHRRLAVTLESWWAMQQRGVHLFGGIPDGAPSSFRARARRLDRTFLPLFETSLVWRIP